MKATVIIFIYSNWQLEKAIWQSKLHSIWKGIEDTAPIVVTPLTTCCRPESTCCTREWARPSVHVSRHRQEDDGGMSLVEMKHPTNVQSNFKQSHPGRERHHTRLRSTGATSGTSDGMLGTAEFSRQEAEDSFCCIQLCPGILNFSRWKLWLETARARRWHNDIDAVHTSYKGYLRHLKLRFLPNWSREKDCIKLCKKSINKLSVNLIH